MSGNQEDEKEAQKVLPLDLARNQITTVRTVDGKAPIVLTSSGYRGMRVVTHPNTGNTSMGGPTIITTNIVPQVLKSDSTGRTQLGIITSSQGNVSGNLTIQQRPTQITLSAPLVAQAVPTGTSYHVPRGPAVVASLAAPRSNVSSVRTPLVVSAQGQPHGFVRPPRTPSPATGTAWLTNTSNGSQIKGAPTVLSSPVRGATVTGKPQIITRTQAGPITSMRPGTILQNAIITQSTGQAHYKAGTGGIQALNNTVTIAQVLPSRTQAVVYSTTGHLTPTARIGVASTIQNARQPQGVRPIGQVATARLTVPINVSQAGARLMTPQVLTTGARISAVSNPNQTVLGNITGSTTARIVSTQANVSLGRLSVASAPSAVSSNNLLGQARISTLNTLNIQSLVAVANPQNRTIQTQGPKVITQPAPGTIHLTSLQSPTIKTTQSVVSTSTRTINVPAIVSQRPSNIMPSQAISIAKVLSSGESQSSGQPANVYIHTQAAGARKITPSVTTSQPLRFNMVLEQSRGAQQPQFNLQNTVVEHTQDLVPTTKMTSSPRPSILRKRDHEGSPLKHAKNLSVFLSNLPPQSTAAPISPPERPDSRGNGNTSGGSTTISATSSPGVPEVNEDSMPHAPMNTEKDDEVKAPIEMSPRKKPRKQQLTGSLDLVEHNDDMQFLSESHRRGAGDADSSDVNMSDEPRDGAPEAGRVAPVRKPATASLLNSYRQTWKATHNHYLRYSDVRPKEDRKATIMDLANMYRVLEKVNGWKIHHLSTQMDDLADQEQSVYNQLTDLLKCMESVDDVKTRHEKDVNRINELIKGNMQRIKIINDGMIDAKSQIMKIFDHKVHVTDIINRCASKRSFKKREKC